MLLDNLSVFHYFASSVRKSRLFLTCALKSGWISVVGDGGFVFGFVVGLAQALWMMCSFDLWPLVLLPRVSASRPPGLWPGPSAPPGSSAACRSWSSSPWFSDACSEPADSSCCRYLEEKKDISQILRLDLKKMKFNL